MTTTQSIKTYTMSQLDEFANDIIRMRTAARQPVPAACLWIYNSRHLNGGLSLFRERGGPLLIEAEDGVGVTALVVADEREARRAAAALVERGLYFNDTDPR